MPATASQPAHPRTPEPMPAPSLTLCTPKLRAHPRARRAPEMQTNRRWTRSWLPREPGAHLLSDGHGRRPGLLVSGGAGISRRAAAQRRNTGASCRKQGGTRLLPGGLPTLKTWVSPRPQHRLSSVLWKRPHPTHTLCRGWRAPKHLSTPEPEPCGTFSWKKVFAVEVRGSHFCGCAGPWVRAGFSPAVLRAAPLVAVGGRPLCNVSSGTRASAVVAPRPEHRLRSRGSRLTCSSAWGPSQIRDPISVPCTARRILNRQPTRKPQAKDLGEDVLASLGGPNLRRES